MSEASFDRFRTSVLARSSSRKESARLSEIGQCQRTKRGEEIILDTGLDQLVFLSEGVSKLEVLMPDESEHVLAFHFPGDMIYVPHHGHKGMRIVALSTSRAIIFPANDFFDAAEREAAVLRAMLERTLLALQRSRDVTIRIGRKAAQERIADFLLAMAERIGVADGNSLLLTLPMSRRDIGNSLALTIETVSRQFTELRDEQLISTSGRSMVWLHDLDELAIRAGRSANPQL